MNRVALVEDHEGLAEMIAIAFVAQGIGVDIFGSIAAIRASIESMPFAALIVDRGLPDGDGLGFVRELRAKGRATPCLVLTARDAVHDRIVGLDSGADDYLAKPFSTGELIARVRALMRRPPLLQALAPSYEGLSVQIEQSEIEFAGRSTTLAAAEMQMLVSLVRAGGATVRRTALEAAAWGVSCAVTPNAMDVALHRMRKKLAAIGAPIQIENVRSLGYRLKRVDDACDA